MKVKELIRQLQEADPTGEIEACVDNIDIHFVERQPAYYDGRLQVLKRDPTRTGRCYDICGAEIKSDGQKIQIHTLSIQDAIWEHPDLPVTPDGSDAVAKWRKEARDGQDI